MFGDPATNSKNLPIATLQDLGTNLDNRRIPITGGDRKAGEYPYYGASGIVDYVADYIFDDDLLLISEDGANLVARVTPIAFPSTGKVWINNHAHVIKFNSMAMQCYVENLLNMMDISLYVTGTAQPKLNQAKLNSIPIPVPEEDQIREYLEFVKQSDKSKFVRFKSQFIEMFGDPLSENCCYKKISILDACDNITGGGTPSKKHPEYYEGSIPWVSPKDMNTSIIEDSQDHITEEAITKSTTKLIPEQSVLMVIRSGVLKHDLPIAINKVPVTINQDMKAFLVGSKIIPQYLFGYFKTIEADVLRGVRAVTADNIEFKVFQKRLIQIPPMDEQQKFAEFMIQSDKSK